MPTLTTTRITEEFIRLVRAIYGTGYIPLHRPLFTGNEKQYLLDCIDSNFVSSAGAKVGAFEEQIAAFTASKYAVATVNGTAALHIALQLVGVQREDEVISQALTFVATCNAINYCGAYPVFVDVDRDTMGMSPSALQQFLQNHAQLRSDGAYNKLSGRRIAACVPMHTFGIPCRIAEIAALCAKWQIPLVEDAAEALGSYVNGQHAGRFGVCGVLSFNGNKIITTGGGGMIICDDEKLAKRAKHLTTTAKISHEYEFVHDEVGYNYRLPNLNAALGCAQVERLPWMLEVKQQVADRYRAWCGALGLTMAAPLPGDVANNWLNALVLANQEQRDAFLHTTNAQQVMTRPLWRLMSDLEMFRHCQHDGLDNSRWLEQRVVNVPSSVPDDFYFGS